MPQGLRLLLGDTDGATSIEYGLIAALIACGLILSLNTVGNSLSTVFSSLANGLAGGTARTAPAPPVTNRYGG